MYKHKFIDYYTEAEKNVLTALKTGMAAKENIGQLKEFISVIKESIIPAPVFNLGTIDKESVFMKDYLQFRKDFENKNTTVVEFIKSYLNPRHLNLPHKVFLLEYGINMYERLSFADDDNQGQPATSIFNECQLEELKKTTMTTGIVVFQDTPILPGLQNHDMEKSMMMQVLPGIRAEYEKEEFALIKQLERACSIFVFFPERENPEEKFYMLAPQTSSGYFSDFHRIELVQQTGLELLIALKFIDIINCKNVGTEAISPKKLTKKQRRRIKNPETISLMESEYHVIKLLTGNASQSENGASSGKSFVPIDVRRGHFKTYTSDNPLFGKHTGTYWWQPILRTEKDIVYDVTKTKGV